jgi:hypothetical protein
LLCDEHDHSIEGMSGGGRSKVKSCFPMARRAIPNTRVTRAVNHHQATTQTSSDAEGISRLQAIPNGIA